MAGTPVTDQQWELMRAAFQEHGEKPYKVASLAGVNPRTAIKAWATGWPELGRPPIAQVLKDEEIGARARQIHALKQAERQNAEAAVVTSEIRNLAREHAIAVRAQEGEIIQKSRDRVAAALVRSEKLIDAGLRFAEVTRSMFDLEAQKARAWINWEVGVALGKIDPEDKSAMPKLGRSSLNIERAQRILQQLNESVASTVATFHEVMALERLYLGQPTDIIGVTPSTGVESADIDLPQALARIQAAQEAVSAALDRQRVGVANVIDVSPDSDDSGDGPRPSGSRGLIGQPVLLE